MSDVEYQRDVTRLALAALAGGGFALAGSGAIREHGIIDRPTQDIDLFTSVTSTEAFAASTTRLAAAMRERGFEVVERRSAPQFANFSVTSPSSHNPIVAGTTGAGRQVASSSRVTRLSSVADSGPG